MPRRTRMQQNHPESELENGIGLRTANPADRIALRGVRLQSRIAGMSARSIVEQTFVNLEPNAIEAVYTFPLPDGAAVCGFEIVFFDRIFTGTIEEADKASEQYDQAIEQGHGAYLLEQNRPDVFTLRVGNLQPRQAVTIRLSYVQDLEVVDRSVRLVFPTTIAPRYVSGAGADPLDALIDGDALNPPHVLSVPYGLTMDIEVDLGKSLAEISSPSHSIRVEQDRAWRIGFAGGLAEMNRDVVLELALAREQEPFALAATSPAGERFVAVTFVPEFEDKDYQDRPAAMETVFILDCSGSMQGESIAQATAALECCLRSMSAGDRFNICRFGSSYEMLCDEPLVYSQQSLERAVAFVRRGANLGGTELHAPLTAILGERPAGASARNIVLLTDGQVSNEPAIIKLARSKRAWNRIFTFGIGPACSAFLVKGLARATGGAAEFITPGERIEDKVLRAFGRMSSPPVTDVEVELSNADGEVAPREIPAVFEGDAVRLFARLSGRAPETITLRCKTPAGGRSWSVPVRTAPESAELLPLFWARAMIASLEEQESASHISAAAGPNRARLLEISRRYNLLCSLTSFIAIEHRSAEERNQGAPATRRVPVLLAQGWGGIEALAAGTGLGALMCMAPAAAAPVGGTASFARGASTLGGLAKRAANAFLGGADGRRVRMLCDSAAPPPAGYASDGEGHTAKLEADNVVDPLIRLLTRQSAEGAFDRGPGAEAAGEPGDLRRISRVLGDKPAKLSQRDRDAVTQTLVALLMLQRAFADRQSTWKRAAKKASAWVAKKLGVSLDQVNDWLKELSAPADVA